MTENTIQLTIADMNPLTSNEYDSVKQTVNERVLSRIGDKPTRDSFKREYGAIWSVLDIALIVVFLGALAISTQHIFDYVSSIAGAHYDTAPFTTGLRLPQFYAVAIQQIGALLMAESAMIAFFTYWRVDTRHDTGSGKYAHLLLWLALASAGYVLYVNTFGVGLWYDPTSWLAPAVTIGIGVRLEQIFSELISRQAELDTRYTDALAIYERATQDMTTHPDYERILYGEIWHKLATKRGNKGNYDEVPVSFKIQAVQRELKRDNWVNEVIAPDDTVTVYTASRTGTSEANFTQQPVPMMATNGNGTH